MIRALVVLAAATAACGAPQTHPGHISHRDSGVELVLIDAEEPFYVGVTEVTMGQFRRFVEATGYRTDAERGTSDDRHGRGSFTAIPTGGRTWSDESQWRNAFDRFPEVRLTDDHPVVHVSWNDAREFARHYGMRLPTEIEWESAARAGCTTLYPWGDLPAGGAGYANVGDATAARHFGQAEVLFPFDDGMLLAAPVRSYLPNPWGVFDAVGNVAEWVEDSWDDARVVRGGSWCDYPGGASFDSRAGMAPQSRRDFLGFRVAMTPR